MFLILSQVIVDQILFLAKKFHVKMVNQVTMDVKALICYHSSAQKI